MNTFRSSFEPWKATGLACLLALVAGCGGEDPRLDLESALDVEPPSTALALESDGGCLLDADCAAGLFCFQSQCTRECSEDADCADGARCTERGRCEAGGEEDGPLPTETGAALDGEAEADVPTQIPVEVEEAPQSQVEVDPGQTSVTLSLRTATPVPAGAILYRVELEGHEGETPETRRALGERDFQLEIPTGRAALVGEEAELQRAYVVTSVGGFSIEIVPRRSLSGVYAGEVQIAAFGGAGIPIRFGLRVTPETAGLEDAESVEILLPATEDELFAPRRVFGAAVPWVARPLEYDPVAGVWFARFGHSFALGDDSVFHRETTATRSIRLEVAEVEGERIVGAVADRWQGLYDARSADGVVAPGQVSLAGQMLAHRISSLPEDAAEAVEGQASVEPPPVAGPIELTACGDGAFDALLSEASPIESPPDATTTDPCPGIRSAEDFTGAASEVRADCALALADTALQGESTAGLVRAFLDDSQPNPGGISFGEFLDRCAAGRGYCVPTPEILCSEQLVAFAYQGQTDELPVAGALLDRYQLVAREAYLGRQLAAFQVDTDTRLEWLQTSEAPLYLASQLQSYNETILSKWEKEVLEAHFEVLARQFAPSSLEVLARTPTDPVAISTRKQMLLEQAQTWQGAMEALQIGADRWNSLYQNDTKRADAAKKVRTRTVDLYLSAAVLAQLNRSSGASAVSSVFGSGFAALLRSLEQLSLPISDLVFMRDAEVVVSRSVDPSSDSNTLLREREALARRAIADAQASVDRVLADAEASEVNEAVLTDRMSTQLDALRSELVTLCGLPAGCTPADMAERPECQVQVAAGRCGFRVDPTTGQQAATFDELSAPENVSEGASAVLAYRQAILDKQMAEEAFRANEERARIAWENADAFAEKVSEWDRDRRVVASEVQALLQEMRDLKAGQMERELATIAAAQAERQAAYDTQASQIKKWDDLRYEGIEADMELMTAINALQSTAAEMTRDADAVDAVATASADGLPKATGLSYDLSAPARLAIAMTTYGVTSVMRRAALGMNIASTRIDQELTEAQARREAKLEHLSDLQDLQASWTDVQIEDLAANLRRHELQTDAAVRVREALLDALKRNLELDLAHDRDLVELRDRRDKVQLRLAESPALRVGILRAEIVAAQRIQDYMLVVQRAQLLDGRARALAERLNQLDVLIASPATIFAFANRLGNAESRVERAKGLLYDWLVGIEYYAVRPFVSQRLAILLARNPSQLEAIADELVRLQRVCGGRVNTEVVDLSLRDDLLGADFDVQPDGPDGAVVDAAARFRAVLERGNVPVDTQVRYSADERIGDLITSRSVLAASFDLRLTDFANLPLTCNAKLASIDVELVGEGLGENVRPVVSLLYDGTSSLRSCQPGIDEIVAALEPGTTAFRRVTRFRTQGRSISPIANIGTFGAEDSANRGLEGLPLASTYTLLIDPAAGENRRVDWDALEDVRLRITYAYQDAFPEGQCQ